MTGRQRESQLNLQSQPSSARSQRLFAQETLLLFIQFAAPRNPLHHQGAQGVAPDFVALLFVNPQGLRRAVLPADKCEYAGDESFSLRDRERLDPFQRFAQVLLGGGEACLCTGHVLHGPLTTMRSVTSPPTSRGRRRLRLYLVVP